MFVYTGGNMKVVTTRIDDNSINDLKLIETEEKSERAEVVRKLMAVGIKKWKIDYVIGKLKKRELSISKAAEIAGVTFSDMLDLMGKTNVDIGYTLQNLENDFRTIKKK